MSDILLDNSIFSFYHILHEVNQVADKLVNYGMSLSKNLRVYDIALAVEADVSLNVFSTRGF